jgi:hypothetical protein
MHSDGKKYNGVNPVFLRPELDLYLEKGCAQKEYPGCLPITICLAKDIDYNIG